MPIGCNRNRDNLPSGLPLPQVNADGTRTYKIPASTLGLQPRPYCNHLVITMTCDYSTTGITCPAQDGSSMALHPWPGTGAGCSNYNYINKLGPNNYRINFADICAFWEGGIYFTITTDGPYDFNIDTSPDKGLTSCAP